MARFVTVALECKNEKIRSAFAGILATRRGIVLTQAKGPGAADIVILELDEANPQRTFTQVRATVAAATESEVFLTASRTDPQIMLEAFRLGVREFLPEPINPQEVEAALQRFEERSQGRNPVDQKQMGKVVSVIGTKGGVGTSTIATSLAVSVKQISKMKSVALVDLNFQDSDLPLFLDLPAPRGLRDLSQDLSRLDETILHSVLAKHESGIDLLPSGYDGLDGAIPPQGCVVHTLELLRSSYDHVFVDCGHSVDATIKEAFDCSSKIIVVMTLSLPAIHRTKRLLGQFRDIAYCSDKVVIVVNRYADGDEELLRRTEEVLQQKIAYRIPNDYCNASSVINNGKPLTVVAPRAAITQWYLKYAAALSMMDQENIDELGRQADAKKASLFARYFPSFGFDAKAKLQAP